MTKHGSTARCVLNGCRKNVSKPIALTDILVEKKHQMRKVSYFAHIGILFSTWFSETQNEFERNIEKLLYDITSHKCSLDTLVPEYIKRFGTLDTTEYFGHQKLLNLLEAIPNTVQVRFILLVHAYVQCNLMRNFTR